MVSSYLETRKINEYCRENSIDCFDRNQFQFRSSRSFHSFLLFVIHWDFFVKTYQLPFDRHYAVAPHHTGIYPINPTVYKVWYDIMNITVTSTENYPYHYDLPSNRRGFIYHGLSVRLFSFHLVFSIDSFKVLPRQSCGLYTTTRNYSTYPNGSHRLEQSLMGGKLFRMILTNPVRDFLFFLIG